MRSMGSDQEVSAAVVQLLQASRAFTRAYTDWAQAGGPAEDPRREMLRVAEARLEEARQRVAAVQPPFARR